MTREEAQQLIEAYKNFPASRLFRLKPISYPIFYLLECFAKGWPIEYLDPDLNKNRPVNRQINFDFLIDAQHSIDHKIWRFVARNPELKNTALGFVQEDLFCRYVGKCNPLKPEGTSWTFLPYEVTKYEDSYLTWKEIFQTDVIIRPFRYPNFRGRFKNHIKYFQVEIDLDTTDIIGTWDKKVPFHYLQQTIDWKPWRDELPWEGHQ